MWKLKMDAQCLPQSPSTFSFEIGFLKEPRAGLSSQQDLGFLLPLPPQLVLLYTLLFTQALRIELGPNTCMSSILPTELSP